MKSGRMNFRPALLRKGRPGRERPISEAQGREEVDWLAISIRGRHCQAATITTTISRVFVKGGVWEAENEEER